MAETDRDIMFELPKNYLWVMVGIIAMNFHFALSGVLIMCSRRRFFTYEYMKQNFGIQHVEATGRDVSAGGYPDMGSGLYAKGLGEKGWKDFNNSMRGHQNYKENFTLLLATFMLLGYVAPISAAISLAVVVLGRVLYDVGYRIGGAGGKIRSLGALTFDVVMLGGFIALLVFGVMQGFF